ncbi:MAG: hypothetical protein HKN73_19180 [Gemmatimonadetes bacterium]|nr:hypothetical protein [Gemmatimonadota bacterium]
MRAGVLGRRCPQWLGVAAVFTALVACDESSTNPEPTDTILRFDVTITGNVVLATGDTLLFEGVTGELNVAQPFDLASQNGANEVDVALFTTDPPAAGVNAIRFATNTIMTGPNMVGTTGQDVADVITDTQNADVEATLLTAELGTDCTTPPPDNVFSADSVYKMVTGQVFVSLPAGLASGTLAFGGNPCDGSSSAATILSATFSGNRIQ